jgi:outer membrane protein assembly factor BamB
MKRIVLCICAAFLGVSIGAPAALAAVTAPRVTLSPNANHPGGVVVVTATGFAAFEAVDIFLDTADTALMIADSSGKVSSASLTLPDAAPPGRHWVTAIGRHSGVGAQAAVTVRTDWPQAGYGSGRLSRNPYENVLSADTVAALGVAWVRDLGADHGYLRVNAPAIVGGRVFVLSGDAGLMTFDALTGAPGWTGPALVSFNSPAISGGLAYATSSNAVTASTASNGASKWSAALSSGANVGEGMSVVGGAVGAVYWAGYDGSFNGILTAYNAKTGAVRWSKSLSGVLYASPAYADGAVFEPTYSGQVYAIDAATGATRWSVNPDSVAFSASPVVANGLVYCGSYDGKLYAFSATTGATRWSFATAAPIRAAVAIENGVVYAASQDGVLYALKAASGSVLWRATLSYYVQNGMALSPPVVSNGVVYVGSIDGTFSALDARTGDTLWAADTGGPIYSPAAVVDGHVYVASGSGKLFAFALNAGNDALRLAAQPAPTMSALRPDPWLKPTR